jgi:hypothetical protein
VREFFPEVGIPKKIVDVHENQELFARFEAEGSSLETYEIAGVMQVILVNLC